MSKEKQLVRACENGNLNKVKDLLNQGANIHYYDDDPLHIASEYGHLDIVKYLIEQGADIHASDDYALCLASNYGHLYIVEYLISKGVDIRASNNHALRCASKYSRLDVVKYLIPYYNSTELINIHFYNKESKLKMFKQYAKMKFHVLLLFRIHKQNLPLELQNIIFQYI